MKRAGVRFHPRFLTRLFVVFLCFLVPAGIATIPASGADRNVFIPLAKRQMALYEAEIKSDWRAMYELILPAQRTGISLAEFMSNPFFRAEPQLAKISGASTPVTPGEPELNIKFSPAVFGYRLGEFRLSDDGSEAVVYSEARIPGPVFMGMVVLSVPNVDFWKQEGGEWYLDIGKERLHHLSGAVTGKPDLSTYTNSAGAEELSKEFLAEAESLPHGSAAAEIAFSNALLLDTAGSVKRIAERKINAGSLPVLALKKSFQGYDSVRNYFEPMMEEGDLYFTAGDYESAYGGYLAAHFASQANGEATAGSIRSAVSLERWREASEHFMDLLTVASITGESFPETLESFIRGECVICGKVPVVTLSLLARVLSDTGRWELAASIYQNVLQASPFWPDASESLLQGDPVEIKDFLIPELRGGPQTLTFAEITELFKAVGIRCFHPGDGPAGFDISGMTFIVESVPSLLRENAANGVYSTSTYPAAARIRWGNEEVAGQSSGNGGGFVATFIRKGKASGKYYADVGNGTGPNAGLLDAIEGLKKGSGIILARAGTIPFSFDSRTLSAFESMGVDTTLLKGRINSLVIFGMKGGRLGSARVFNGDGTLRKTFLPSNLKGFKDSRGPAVALFGLAGRDTVVLKK